MADVFLVQLGAYSDPVEVYTDYRAIVKSLGDVAEVAIDPSSPFPVDTFEHPSIPLVSRFGLRSHREHYGAWNTPGFSSGDVTNFRDLVCYWNLRAAGIPLLFVDPRHIERFKPTIPAWGEAMREIVSALRDEFMRSVAVWVRQEALEDTAEALSNVRVPFGEYASTVCRIGDGTWNGLNVRAPVMHLGEVTTLGIIEDDSKQPKVSFALPDKPFSDEPWFHNQSLIVSTSFRGGLFSGSQHTFAPPFIPELNEYYSRTMRFHHDSLRSESERIGVVVATTDQSCSLHALPLDEMFQRLLGLAGFSSKLSAGGLVLRQLIAQLGGVDGARPFKIPGVRRLLKTYGPTSPFTRKSALARAHWQQGPPKPCSKF